MALEQHPKIVRATQKISDALKRLTIRSRYSTPAVFLCGGFKSPNREALRAHLEALPGTSYRVFYAEVVWDALYDVIGANALRMEEYLAALADVVVIIVESPGTFAELGAFSTSPMLRKKLLLLMDGSFEFKSSFLNTGPTRWVADDSQFGAAIWCGFPLTPETLEDVAKRLNECLQKSGRPRDTGESMRQSLYRLCDIVYLVGPCSEATLESLVPQADSSDTVVEPALKILLGVAQALGLIRRVSRSGRANIYYRPVDPAGSVNLLYFEDIPRVHQLRAQWLEALTRVPEGRYAINSMQRRLR